MNDKFPLEAARGKAREIIEALREHSERIEIAGSIRRAKPWVKDIDLVVVPKMKSKDALFGTTTAICKTDFYAAVKGILASMEAEGPRLLRGKIWAGDKLMPVDLYLATAETWATLLLIRTGSAEHNIWMCLRAKACGGKLHADGSGLEVRGQYDVVLQRTVNHHVIRAKTEEEVFKALGIATPAPEERECVNGRPVWMRGATA